SRGILASQKEPIDGIPGLLEGGDDVRPNFVAAGPNRWTDDQAQVRPSASEASFHSLDQPARDAAERAAPASVGDADCTSTRIVSKNRHAVRESEPERESGSVGDQTVGIGHSGLATIVSRTGVRLVGVDNATAVDLRRTDD